MYSILCPLSVPSPKLNLNETVFSSKTTKSMNEQTAGDKVKLIEK